MCAHHVKFVAKTVLVRNNDVEAAYRALDRWIDNFMRCFNDAVVWHAHYSRPVSSLAPIIKMTILLGRRRLNNSM